MHTHLLLSWLVACVVLLAILAVAAQNLAGSANVDRYFLRDSLLTPAERSFYGVLRSLDYEGVTIACKVRLVDFLGLKKGLSASERRGSLNRIVAKHVDFLLFRQSDARPVLAIELDDKSHQQENRRARDAFVDGVFAEVGLPIVRFAARASYNPKEILRVIDDAMSKNA